MRLLSILCSLVIITVVLGVAQEPAAGVAPEKIRQAMDRGAQFLATRQSKEHNWEGVLGLQLGDYQGGTTALVCLALLEAGSKPDEAPLKESLRYLRQLKMKKTYCQGLRMAALAYIAKHHPALAEPGDKALIKNDRDQLMQFVVREKAGQIDGWSYPIAQPTRADFSNTHFAVLGLQAAQEAGVETSKEDWQAVRDLFVRSQQAGGGWGYTPDQSGERLSMTLACIAGLSASCQQLKEAPPEKTIDAAFNTVSRRLRPEALFDKLDTATFPYYTLFALSRASTLTPTRQLKNRAGKEYNLFDEMSSLLLKKQAADGSWGAEQGMLDKQSVMATSFTLIYLAKGRVR